MSRKTAGMSRKRARPLEEPLHKVVDRIIAFAGHVAVGELRVDAILRRKLFSRLALPHQDRRSPTRIAYEAHFLRADSPPQCQVGLVSYPRSGNSMLRGLLERLFGVFTGSDTRPDYTLSRSLIDYGMAGEGICDRSVEVVKSHWPERHGHCEFSVGKALVLVRNPFDAMDSYFNMALTNTHNVSLEEENYRIFQEEWQAMVENEIRVWARFYTFWFGQDVPVLALRYEDLLLHTSEMLRRIIAFMRDVRYADVPTAEPALWARALRIVELDSKEFGPYRPRSGGIGKGLRHYSEEQVRMICSVAGTALRNFGYHPHEQDFPKNSGAPPPMLACLRRGVPGSRVTVNSGASLRADGDRFGRNFSKLRKRHTKGDRSPLSVCAKADSDVDEAGSGA